MNARPNNLHPMPRFVTDAQLRAHFGLSARALNTCRQLTGFPQKDELVGKTDLNAVDFFFDRRAGIAKSAAHGYPAVIDGEENFE